MLETVSTSNLRRRARRLGWSARFIRHFNNIAGKEGYVICNALRNHVVGFCESEGALREWLSEAIAERREAC